MSVESYIFQEDVRYLKMAYEVALKYSRDPSSQNGAVLVNSKNVIISHGANHFPFNVKETEERWERPLKYSYVEHAERNCIYDAARKGQSTVNSTIYVPFFACADCARAIIQSGITEVVGHDCEARISNPNWHEKWKKSVEIGDEMFKEAGITFRRIKHYFGMKILSNEEWIEV